MQRLPSRVIHEHKHCLKAKVEILNSLRFLRLTRRLLACQILQLLLEGPPLHYLFYATVSKGVQDTLTVLDSTNDRCLL